MIFNAKGLFVKVLLSLLAFSFVVATIIGFIAGIDNNNVVIVNGKKININTFASFLSGKQNQISQSNLTSQDLEYLKSLEFKKMVLSEFITEELMTQKIEEFKLQEPEKSVLNAIYNDDIFKNAEGKFDIEQFKTLLSQNNLTEKDYINYISSFNSRNMLLDTLSTYNSSNMYFLNLFSKYVNRYLVVDMFTIKPQDLKFKQTQPAEKEIEEYYNNNKDFFFMPEQKVISFVEVDLNSYDNEEGKQKLSQLEDLIISANNIDLVAQAFQSPKQQIIYIKNQTELPEDFNVEILNYSTGVFSDLIYKDNNKYKVYYLEEIIPSKYLNLEESKEQIAQIIMKQNESKHITETLNKYAEDLKNSKNPQQYARRNKIMLEKNETIYRDNLYYSQEFLQEMFNLNNSGDFTAPYFDEANDLYMIAEIKNIEEINENNIKFLPADAFADVINSSYNASVLSEFREYLFNSNKLEVREELLNMLQ